ncbi:hypothetical protein H0H93_003492 [Arthromyces matolae]|nr:hypothetical protein H0H93_003492 [Arthromyces matolae]
MPFRRPPIPFLGALGVTLTTLAVGYGTYRYLRTQRAQRPPVYSGCNRPPPSQKPIVPPPEHPARRMAPLPRMSILHSPTDNLLSPSASPEHTPMPLLLQPPAQPPAPRTPPPPYNDSPRVGSSNYTYSQSSTSDDSDDELPYSEDSSYVDILNPPSGNSSSQSGLPPSHQHEDHEESSPESIPQHGVESAYPQMSTPGELDELQLTSPGSSSGLVNFGLPLAFAEAQTEIYDESALETYPQHEIQGPHLQTTSANDDIEDQLTPVEGLDYTPQQLVRKACHVSMNASTRTITLVIQPPADDTLQLEMAYIRCRDALNNSPNTAKVLAILTREHRLSLFSLICLGKALRRLAADDTERRCKSLDIQFPLGDIGVTSRYPDLLPLTMPELQTLEWSSNREQLHLIGIENLNCLTNLTLETSLSPRDCLYLLHHVSRTLRACTIGSLEQGDDVFPHCTRAYLPEIESFSVEMHLRPITFLNRLVFNDKKLRALDLTVETDNPVNPAAIKSIPWEVIKNINISCTFVDGGHDWVRWKAVQAESCNLRSSS